MRIAWFASIAAVLLSLESVAQACSGDCQASEIVPSHEAIMPINAAGIRWLAAGGAVEGVVLRDLASNLELPIAFGESSGLYDLRPAEPLEPYKSYRFEIPAGECSDAFYYDFVTSEAVEIASNNLGTLTADPPDYQQVEVPESVSCSIYVDAVRVKVDLELNPELLPFGDLLMYETLVDGEPWVHIPRDFAPPQIGRSWIGRGVDIVFATCPAGSDGLPHGTHEVQMLARIPGLPDVVLASNPVEVVLECPPDEIDTSAGDDENDESGGESGSFVPFEPVDEAPSCGCNSESGRSPAAVVAPLVVLLAIRRRRRAR